LVEDVADTIAKLEQGEALAEEEGLITVQVEVEQEQLAQTVEVDQEQPLLAVATQLVKEILAERVLMVDTRQVAVAGSSGALAAMVCLLQFQVQQQHEAEAEAAVVIMLLQMLQEALGVEAKVELGKGVEQLMAATEQTVLAAEVVAQDTTEVRTLVVLEVAE
jgi:hypothetical protein